MPPTGECSCGGELGDKVADRRPPDGGEGTTGSRKPKINCHQDPQVIFSVSFLYKNKRPLDSYACPDQSR